jgi:56kDa selenium binding protein (SBP56)
MPHEPPAAKSRTAVICEPAPGCCNQVCCEKRLLDMMHVTGDGKRMYVTNSLSSTLDRAGRLSIRPVHIGPDGMKVDPFFNVDLNHLKTGPAGGHDMPLN